ncbi:RNA-directed DNA polymerase, eukaryota [Tanacetum coccineum]
MYNLFENEHELSGNVADSSIPFPPGFTPPTPKDASIEQEVFDSGAVRSHNQSVCSRILEDTHVVDSELGSDGDGQAMGFSMVGCEKDIEGIIGRHGDEEVKLIGLQLLLISVWDPSVFHFENHTVSDNFIALYGLWKPTKTKLLVISVYAPQALSEKRTLWNFLSLLISRWDGECLVMGDFNEVRCEEERLGTVFNVLGANAFNDFILNSNLLDVRLDGFSFTWSHRSASKMSKLDRFLISDGFHSSFPHMSGICLDRHLSDHRPILFRDVCIDYGATPFRLFHSWFDWDGFDIMVSSVWSSMSLSDSNGMVRFKKKLQYLKKEICSWVMEHKKQNMGNIYDIKSKLHDVGGRGYRQKAKIRWAVEGDENSKLFHSIVNKKRSSLSIRGILVDGEWVSDPVRVKEDFRLHFAKRFEEPAINQSKISFQFPTRLNSDQALDLERPVSCDEIRQAVWGCGEDKSPGPDGFTFEFFRKFWDIIGPDFCVAVKWWLLKILALRLLADYLRLISDVKMAFGSGHLLGVEVSNDATVAAATNLGCAIMKAPFKYLGVHWDKWSKVLAAKQFSGLGVSSLFSLNRALLMRWVWRFIFHDNSFWCRFISAVHGPSFQVQSGTSLRRTITSEVNGLKAQGVDILSHCLKWVGNGLSTKFWFDPWIVNVKLCNEFPRLFVLELNKSISVAEKLQHLVDTSFRRSVRGGSESAQLESLSELIEGVILSNSRDHWFWDMNGSGTYRVKDVRNMLDDFFLPKDEVASRWLPHLSIKLNVFAWRLYLDRLPTKSNLIRRGIQVGSPICPNCISYDEDVPHIFFKCHLAIEVSWAVCRWWDVVWVPCGSYSE